MDNRGETPTRFILETSIANFEKKYGEVVNEQELLDIIDKEIAQIRAKGGPDMEVQLQKVYEEQEKILEFFRRYKEDKDISIRDLRQEFAELELDIEMVEGMGYGQKVIDIIQMIEDKGWEDEGSALAFYKKNEKDASSKDILFSKNNARDKVVSANEKYSIDDLLENIYKAKNSWKHFGRAIEYILYYSKSGTSSEYRHFLDEKDKELLLDFVFERAKNLDKNEKNYSRISLFRMLKGYPKFVKKLLGMMESITVSEMFASVLLGADGDQEIIDRLLEKSQNVIIYASRDLFWSLENTENNSKLKEFILERLDGDSIQDSSYFIDLLLYPEVLDKCCDFSKFSMNLGKDLDEINDVIELVADNDFAFVYALYNTLEHENLNQIVLEKAKDLKFTHKGAYQLFQAYKDYFPKHIIDIVESKKL